jgi:hypothetical protein
MRFPNPWRTQQNDIAGFVTKSQWTQFPDLPLIQRWLKTEIELLEGFQEGKMCPLHPRPKISTSPKFPAPTLFGRHFPVGSRLSHHGVGKIQTELEGFLHWR